MIRPFYFILLLLLLTVPAATATDLSTLTPRLSYGADIGAENRGLQQQLLGQDTALLARCYRPVAVWSGRLILPPADRRSPDGSVWFEVHNSPRRDLVGKRLWLGWDGRQPWNRWFDTLRFDVHMDPAEAARAEEKHRLVLPRRLDGWKRVSALESLAAGRVEGIVVSLKDPVFDGNALRVCEEPVQVCGNAVALVRFDGPAEGNLRRIRHYNPASRDFDGPEEVIAIPAEVWQYKDDPRPISSTRGLEKSDLNPQGWYLYGFRRNGVFEAAALEPRLPLRVAPSWVVHGRDAARQYISRQHWGGLAPGLHRSTLIAPDGRLSSTGRAAVTDYMQSTWPIGAKGIVVHLFGWRKLAEGKKGPMDWLGLVTGHFAYGLAEVVRDPFTGEARFDIEYRQVYAHNRGAIVAGTMKWHAYMGNLARGWMYTIPVSDTVIRIPELAPYDFGGWTVKPLLGFARELEKMQALYRTGAGGGISAVAPDVSCVQDSHCALYGALVTFEQSIARTGKLKSWLETLPAGSGEARRYLSLLELTRKIRKRITVFGQPQWNWRDFAANPLATRKPGLAAKIVNTLLAARTMFPRHAHDEILKLAAEQGYPMWSILTVQTGGTIPGLQPLAPTSPTAR